MIQTKQSPDTAVGAVLRAREHSQSLDRQYTKREKPTPKIWRGVALLSTGRAVHYRQALALINDSCFHSSVSEMQTRLGLEVARRPITIRGYMGEPTRCNLYWLPPDQIEKAKRLMRDRREAAQ